MVKNNTLYVRGGIQTFNAPESKTNWTNSTLGFNSFLLQIDLSKSWDWKKNLTYIALAEQPNPNTGTLIRNGTIQGTMFRGPLNDSHIWTYGGTTFQGNKSFPNKEAYYGYSNNYPLWSFDNSTQLWSQFDINQPATPSYGAAAEATDQALGFYLSGRIDSGSSYTTATFGDKFKPLPGMIVMDLTQSSRARNVSVSTMKDAQPRIGGAMQYVAPVGGNGVLVAIGGQVFDGKEFAGPQDKGRLLGFDTVDVFDIASYLAEPRDNGTWYSQTTSGDIPPSRLDFCTALFSAPDNSSHNIYLYGGRDPTGLNGTIFYDDIYVLSLPSFTWIKVFTGTAPRYGHTCHIVGKRQLLTSGGQARSEKQCDWERKAVAILDVPTLAWGSVYNAQDDPFVIGDYIIGKIGGHKQGGATLKTPEKGWNSSELGIIMSTTRLYNEDGTPFQTLNDSSGLTMVRLAGIIGGSIAGAIFIVCVAWLTRVYRRSRRPQSIASSFSSPVEVYGEHRFELSPDEKKIWEVSGTEGRHEIPDSAVKAEADRANMVTYAVELPTTNFHRNGRWGVPIIRVPSPSMLSRRGSVSPNEDAPPKDAKDMV